MRSSIQKGNAATPGTPKGDPAADTAFTETIIAFSKNLESEQISTDLQNMFLK